MFLIFVITFLAFAVAKFEKSFMIKSVVVEKLFGELLFRAFVNINFIFL